jgi:membrane-bound ClpP family serine protease
MDPLVIALLCFTVAAALAIVDLFVPSGGVLALSSFLAAVISVYFGFRSSSTAGMMMLSVMLIAIPVFLVVALRVWPYTPLGRRIILRTPEAVHAPQAATADPLLELVGQIGVAQNSLLPSGHVRINHRNYNALCESGVIEAGQNVEVIAVRQRNLIVVATTVPTRPTATSASVKADVKQQKLGESLLDLPPEDLGLDTLEG